MKFNCRTEREKIARSILTEQNSSTAHADRCDSCRREAAALRSLDEALRGLSDPLPAPDVEQRVWARIDALARPKPRLHPARVALSLAGAAALAFALWTALPRENAVEALNVRIATSNSAPPKVTPAKNEVAVRPVKRGKPIQKRSMTLARHESRRIYRRHRVHQLKQETHFVKSVAPPRPVQVARLDVKRPTPNPSAVWAAWGAWYEQSGDYERASLAFQRAERAAGEAAPVIYTYQAGRAAECAGDLSTAVDYYSKMLSRPSGAKPEPKTEKGTEICIPFDDTV